MWRPMFMCMPSSVGKTLLPLITDKYKQATNLEVVASADMTNGKGRVPGTRFVVTGTFADDPNKKAPAKYTFFANQNADDDSWSAPECYQYVFPVPKA